jgi:hypothetical protein
MTDATGTVFDDETELSEAPGTTMVLTEDGWEAVDYIAPEDDWHLAPDGSMTSPDGRTRSWLLTGSGPD